jgi:predicted dehydrogenase
MRIGLVGCGSWGRHILRDLIALGASVPVADPAAPARAAAQLAGAVSTHATLETLPVVDGYVVATPTRSHAGVIEALLPARRPIFVEKPLTDDPEAAQHIARRADGHVFVMDKWRYHAGVRKLAEIAASGQLGGLRHLQTWRLGWQTHDLGLDSVWVLLPHDLAITLEILGHLPPLQSARGFAVMGGRSHLSVTLQAAGGPTVGIEVSGCLPISRRRVSLVGETAVADWEDADPSTLRLRLADGTEEVLTLAADMPLRAELQAFLDHLAGGPPPKSPVADATAVVQRIAEIRAMAGLGL